MRCGTKPLRGSFKPAIQKGRGGMEEIFKQAFFKQFLQII
jgi:hypothetical protein